MEACSNETATEEKQPNTQQGLKKARVNMTDEEYWKMKRAKNKERMKENKRKFETKEEYLESEEWKKNQERQKRRRRWRDTDKEQIDFCKPEIVIDLSYSDVMADKEQSSAVVQLVQIYGILKAAKNPLKTHFCGVEGEMEAKLNRAGVGNWKVWTHSESFIKVFSPTSLIYLSPDSPNVLEKLNTDKIYVIGGLVDHNKLKVGKVCVELTFQGLSLRRATEMGIQTARLPMSEILKDKPNTSLNQNHVYNIITDFAHTGNLEKALIAHTPNRRAFQKMGDKKGNKASPNATAETKENSECKPGDGHDKM